MARNDYYIRRAGVKKERESETTLTCQKKTNRFSLLLFLKKPAGAAYWWSTKQTDMPNYGLSGIYLYVYAGNIVELWNYRPY
jgi:hypothetical protein